MRGCVSVRGYVRVRISIACVGVRRSVGVRGRVVSVRRGVN